jgi:hypothetical protein
MTPYAIKMHLVHQTFFKTHFFPRMKKMVHLPLLTQKLWRTLILITFRVPQHKPYMVFNKINLLTILTVFPPQFVSFISFYV